MNPYRIEPEKDELAKLIDSIVNAILESEIEQVDVNHYIVQKRSGEQISITKSVEVSGIQLFYGSISLPLSMEQQEKLWNFIQKSDRDHVLMAARQAARALEKL